MPKRKKKSAEETAEQVRIAFLNVSEKVMSGLRRPNLNAIDPTRIEGLTRAIEDSRGILVVELGKVVELLQLPEAYADSLRASTFAAALGRRLPNTKVGVRKDGKLLTFRKKVD